MHRKEPTQEKKIKIIEIDGSYGEGGGQILRTSLCLSIITGKPVKVYNIRAGRRKPGLKPQHLMCSHAAAQITGGRIETGGLEATELFFYPGLIRPGKYTFDVASLRASAGSTGLIFQTIALPLGFTNKTSHLTIRGGTHVEWSPAADYIKEVFLPTVTPMGIRVDLKNPVQGFYPIGGGELDVEINPTSTPLSPIKIIERGELKKLSVLSAVSNLPLSIARRQLDRAIERLLGLGFKPEGKMAGYKSPGRGTFLFILAEFEKVRGGFSALGAIGKRAEKVADGAVDAFNSFWKGKGALEPHLADQLVLNMSLAEGESSITTTVVTQHLKTNIWVIERFLPTRFIMEGKPGEGGSVKVKGIGLKTS